jgi:hypothetical protein
MAHFSSRRCSNSADWSRRKSRCPNRFFRSVCQNLMNEKFSDTGCPRYFQIIKSWVLTSSNEKDAFVLPNTASNDQNSNSKVDPLGLRWRWAIVNASNQWCLESMNWWIRHTWSTNLGTQYYQDEVIHNHAMGCSLHAGPVRVGIDLPKGKWLERYSLVAPKESVRKGIWSRNQRKFQPDKNLGNMKTCWCLISVNKWAA